MFKMIKMFKRKEKAEKEQKPKTFEMEWAKLEMIAEFYGFPSTVFFLPKEKWEQIKDRDKTRLDALIKSYKTLIAVIEVLKRMDFVRSMKDGETKTKK